MGFATSLKDWDMLMTDMVELKKRKEPINLAIVHVDPQAYIDNIMGWLEITSFISAQRAGEAEVPADGVTPKLTPQQLAGGTVRSIGDDAIFAFCMTASLKGDKAAVDKVEAAMIDSMGKEFPGSYGLWHFKAQIDAPITLEDHVGQAGKKMLAGDIPPPPMRAKEYWQAGLRFHQKARQSNFKYEIMYPLAKWVRAKGEETLEKGISFLAHIEDSVPIIRGLLDETRNDEPFIANYLLNAAPCFDMELNEEAQGFLRSLARR